MRKLVCAALALASWNAAAASIELGRFSYVEAQLDTQYRIYAHQAPVPLTMKVSNIHPVSMGMPLAYTQAQLNALRDCRIELSVTLVDGQATSLKPAILTCPYNQAYDYVGASKVRLLAQGQEQPQCVTSPNCRSVEIKPGRYRLVLMDPMRLDLE